MPTQQKSNFHWTGQNVIIFGAPLMVPQTRIVTRGLAYIPLYEIRFKHNCFPSTAEMQARCYSWEMDRLTLTLSGLDREQEAAIKELFEARGWDYVHEISLPFLNFIQTFLATYNTTVVSVEPETERKG